MAYKLGKCACCGTKIGYYTANGVFKYDRNKMNQISIFYKIHNKSSEVSVPVCKACAEKPKVEDIEKNLEKEINFKRFVLAHKQKEFVKVEKCILPWE